MPYSFNRNTYSKNIVENTARIYSIYATYTATGRQIIRDVEKRFV